MIEIILGIILGSFLLLQIVLRGRRNTSNELVLYDNETIKGKLQNLFKRMNFRGVVIFLISCISGYLAVSIYQLYKVSVELEKVKINLNVVAEPISKNLNNEFFPVVTIESLYFYGEDLFFLGETDYTFTSNQFASTYGIQNLWTKDENESYYIVSDSELIDLFIYNSFFRDFTEFEFKYYPKDNILCKVLFTLFGDGYWLRTGSISVNISKPIYSYDISVEAPNTFKLNNTLLIPETRGYLFKMLEQNIDSNENSKNLAENVILYSIPRGVIYETASPAVSCVVEENHIISQNSNIKFTVRAKKNHQWASIWQYTNPCFQGLNGIPLAVNQSLSGEFELECEADLTHGVNSFYLHNSLDGIKSSHLLGSVIYDNKGPKIEIDYNTYGSGIPNNPVIDGSAIIDCHNWSGHYKPMTVRLSGDIDRLYIDGKRFTFDSSKNPQEIYRRVPVKDYIGFNRVEVVAYDKRGNRSVSYWEFDAVLLD